MALADASAKADIAVDVRNYTRTIGNTSLFESADLRIGVGERVALIGPNGCGKTTFLRDLVSRGDWDDPHLRIGPSIRPAYCAQNQEILVGEHSLIDALQRRFGITAHRARDILGRYRFCGADVEKRIDDLSGGEKNRLQFAYAEISGADFLVLDEPTNHMDITSREVIEDALWEFEGTILLVSHDRYLLQKIAERVVVVEDRGFSSFPGTFGEYVLAGGGFWSRNDDGKGRRLSGARSSQETDNVEKRIMALETEKRDLEARIESAFASGDHLSGRRLAGRLERVVRQIDKLYEDWT